MSSCQLLSHVANEIRQGIKLIIEEIRYFKSLVEDQSCL